MKKNIIISLKLSAILLLVCAGLYPLFIASLGKGSAGKGQGEKLEFQGRIVGYKNLGQKFTDEKYFQGRPSAVDYNAAGSGGSNKSTGDADYLKQIQARIDSFLKHNPDVRINDIPADMVTASGSGLDPHISVAGARIQINRIAKIRGMDPEILRNLINTCTVSNGFGPRIVHVLKLNIALDEIYSNPLKKN